MIRRACLTLAAVLAIGFAFAPEVPAAAQDIRAAARRAAAERDSARAEARRAEEAIFEDRSRLQEAVANLAAREDSLRAQTSALERAQADTRAELERLEEAWSARELDVREISGNVRVAARDLESLLKASPLSATWPQRLERLEPLLREGYFPGLDDIAVLSGLYLDEMARSGQVLREPGAYVDRDGREASGIIYHLGKFTTVFETAGEVGFLTYAPGSQTLYALSKPVGGDWRRMVSQYVAGESPVAPLDLSQGAALRQVAHRPSFLDQLRAGGPIVWPILAIALAALTIVVMKAFFLQRVHQNADRLMGQVNAQAARGDWPACAELVKRHEGRNSPVVHVIRAGLQARGERRETLESVLQEAILSELPRLQRGLAVLAVLGAVAPLLGLLGTVTGMIETFRVITLFGTGDPRLMSGGISEALITTELGLAVAIPIMLLHTFLARRVDHIIGEMEEKAVHLTNLLVKE
ncbi:MAG: MotA/TolQ/ExbB proton channel family protein [Candidatus Krumholzibacteriia bacterium]